MEKLSKDVLEKVDELVTSIKESKEYQKYIMIRNKLDENKDIKKIIKDVKKIQQELVKSEYYKDTEKAKILKESLDNKNKELKSYPIYNEYEHAIEELNEILFPIKDLEVYLETIIK